MALGGTIPLMMKAAAAAPSGDVVTKSVRFDSDAALSSPAFGTSSSDQKKKTLSFWVKRCELNDDGGQPIFEFLNGSGTTDGGSMLFSGAGGGGSSVNDDFVINNRNASSGNADYIIRTTGLFRDVAAFYHFCIKYDTTNSTAADRIQIWVNGKRVTALNTGDTAYPPLNYVTTAFLAPSTAAHTMGYGIGTGSASYLGGYLADFYYIDGVANDATAFAEEDATTGQWKPKATSGLTFGTNGFHLDFKDADAIGNDVSGNDNDFSTSNLVPADVMDDNPSAGMNYCVYNAVFAGATGLSEGNLKCTTTARGTFDAMSFASYWEIEANTTGVTAGIEGESIYGANTVSVTNGSTFGFRLSAAGALDYTSNGSSWTSIATGLTAEAVFPYVTGGTTTANFGQSTLSYSVPSGYAVLSTAGMTATIAKPSAHFNTVTYAGTSPSDNDITTVGFQADLTWIKSRNQTYNHALYDSVRGATEELYPNTTDAEYTDTDGLKSWDGDGFTLGSDGETNDGAGSLVAWNWLAGTSFDAGGGSGTGSKNVDAGFSIATWEGDDDGMGGGP